MKHRLPDAWRLAVGTLTAVPVTPPRRVDRDTAGLAMVLAPLASLPLGILVAGVLWVGDRSGLASTVTGLAAVGVLALGSRAFHLDGLADTADGLTASYDRERSLIVMKSGVVGPAGAAALVIVLVLQAVCLGALSVTTQGCVSAGVAVCASRVALTVVSSRGVPAARPDGLGASHAGSVPRPIAVAAWLAVGATTTAVFATTDVDPWRVGTGFALAALVVVLLVWRAVRRLGGITGDVHGAAIETMLVVLLVAASG